MQQPQAKDLTLRHPHPHAANLSHSLVNICKPRNDSREEFHVYQHLHWKCLDVSLHEKLKKSTVPIKMGSVLRCTKPHLNFGKLRHEGVEECS